MPSLRPPAAAPVTEPPRCLLVRDASVWSLVPGDELAAHRYRAAATLWRAGAHDTGLTNAEVWAALPAGRFLVQPDRQRLEYQLWPLGLTLDDVPILAAEARTEFPHLFDPMWAPAGSTEGGDWHLRDLRARRGELGPA